MSQLFTGRIAELEAENAELKKEKDFLYKHCLEQIAVCEYTIDKILDYIQATYKSNPRAVIAIKKAEMRIAEQKKKEDK